MNVFSLTSYGELCEILIIFDISAFDIFFLKAFNHFICIKVLIIEILIIAKYFIDSF